MKYKKGPGDCKILILLAMASNNYNREDSRKKTDQVFKQIISEVRDHNDN